MSGIVSSTSVRVMFSLVPMSEYGAIWLSGDPKSRSAQSSGSVGKEEMIAGTLEACCSVVALKRFRKSVENPANAVWCWGSFRFGNATMKQHFLLCHVVDGRVEFAETWFYQPKFIFTSLTSPRALSLPSIVLSRARADSPHALHSHYSQATKGKHHTKPVS